MKMPSFAQRFLDASHLEADVVLGPERRRSALAVRMDRELRHLFSAFALVGTRISAERARGAVIALLNAKCSSVLSRAMAAFKIGASAAVAYRADDFGAAQSADEELLFDFDQMPFIRFHGDALAAAKHVRTHAPTDQLKALNLAAVLADLRDPAQAQPDVDWSVGLDTDLATNVEVFVSAMELGAVRPYSIPISISTTFDASELILAAEAYGDLGLEMQLPIAASLEGPEADRQRARTAWTEYGECGLALRVLGGWIRALSLTHRKPTCAICYRHVATFSRCTEHATKTHETREARLGMKVRPSYLSLVRLLGRTALVKAALGANLVSNQSRSEAQIEAAALMVSEPQVRQRALALGAQLQLLQAVFNPVHLSLVTELFAALLSRADEVFALPAARSFADSAQAARRRERALEEVSLKGFFRAWFGYASSTDSVQHYGFDARHPVMTGPLDASFLPRQLLQQRAWEEAFDEYVKDAMPSHSAIERQLAGGLSYAEAAKMYGVSHQSLRATVRRGSERKRNRFN